jgi:hypothetical protein
MVIIPDAEAALTIVNSKSVFRNVMPIGPAACLVMRAPRRRGASGFPTPARRSHKGYQAPGLTAIGEQFADVLARAIGAVFPCNLRGNAQREIRPNGPCGQNRGHFLPRMRMVADLSGPNLGAAPACVVDCNQFHAIQYLFPGPAADYVFLRYADSRNVLNADARR